MIQNKKVPTHDCHSLDDTQKQVGPQNQRPVKQPFLPWPGRFAHYLRVNWFNTQAQCRECVRPHVNSQNLYRGQRQRNFKQGEGQVRSKFRHVMHQDIGQKLADVLKDGSPFLHCVHDAGKVVIQKYYVR